MKFYDEVPLSERGGRSASLWFKEVAELKAHPRQWAILCTKDTPAKAYSMSNAIRYGRIAVFRPTSDFEVKSRKCDVWVRYIGPTT